MTSKRKLDIIEEGTDKNDYLSFVALGGGNEVGRSCHIIEFKGKTIMLDAGVHPAYNGLAALPFYDEYDLSSVNILLISHFHLDHAASLPYVMQKTNFKGRVFMTHPTKAIYKWLLSDFVRVSNISSSEDQLYNEKDLIESFERIEAVDYHSTIEIEGVKFTPYHAGHVLGAAMYFIEIAGIKILFTGDYSREEDRHLNIAEIPSQKPDILITESTYGTASHQPRLEKEARLTSLIHTIIKRGGKVLMPMFALGNTQEILLILDEYWESHPELHNIPIYYASALARKCMAVYQTYVNMLNDRIRLQFKERNPFVFRHVSSLKSLEKFQDIGPCVMLASPGMLQNGVSRELLERWCTDSRNGLIIAGFSVEGTMAKHILNEPLEIQSLSGQKLPRRMSVEEISFAAHVDYGQNSSFIEAVDAKHIILVHGEQTNMGRLKSALLSKYSHRKGEVNIYNPKNCETIKMHFRSDKYARALGALAKQEPSKGQILKGVIVQKDFKLNLMLPEDLKEYSGLMTSTIVERQIVAYSAGSDLLRWHLEQMFGTVEVKAIENSTAIKFTVMGAINIAVNKDEEQLVLEWVGNSMNDTVADTVLAIIVGIESSPASVKITSKPCKHHPLSDLAFTERLLMFLKAQFGDALCPSNTSAEIIIDKYKAMIDYKSLHVHCEYEPLRSRIKRVIENAVDAITPFFNEVPIKTENPVRMEKITPPNKTESDVNKTILS